VVESLLGGRSATVGDEEVQHGVRDPVGRLDGHQRLEFRGLVPGLLGEFSPGRGLEIVVIGLDSADGKSAADSRDGLSPLLDADDVAVGVNGRTQTLGASERGSRTRIPYRRGVERIR